MRAIEKYQCGNCEVIYEKIANADYCCINTLYVFVCSKCDIAYNDIEEAEECCKELEL